MRKNDKSLYLAGQASSSGLKTLNSQKVTRTFCNGDVRAERRIIKASDVESHTQAHPLNPRNQVALTLDSVRDILPSIEREGVNVEGIAIKCSETGVFLLLDSTRRRFCCITANKDLPVWELIGTVKLSQMVSLIQESQKSKKWSYREEGKTFLRVKEDKNFSTIEELAEELNIGRETVRKKVKAAEIDAILIEIFSDFEGIPNTFYSKLAKIESSLIKHELSVDEFVKDVQTSLPEYDGDVEQSQSSVLEHLTNSLSVLLDGDQSKKEWVKSELANYGDKKKYARKNVSPDGNVIKYEFSRLNKKVLKEIEQFIALKLDGNG